jgi:hypothetical protein
MQEIEYIALNLANNLSSSRIASFMIDNKRFNENYFQTEILNSTLMFNNPGLIENTHVYFIENNGHKRYIEFLILNENPILELDEINNESAEDTSYFILLIKDNLKSNDLEKIEKKINNKFETKFNNKSFKLLNGRFCILFYSQCQSLVLESKKSNKRKKVSLPRGTYLKTLKNIKHWLEDYGEITFSELMEKFESEIKNQLLKLNESEIDIEDELNIFRQEYGTGAKRSQILLHTVNEKNRIHFRSIVPSEYDSFYYVDNDDNDININDRKISAFNPHDRKQNEIEVYYEKGKSPIKVIDFKNRYEIDFNSSYKK